MLNQGYYQEFFLNAAGILCSKQFSAAILFWLILQLLRFILSIHIANSIHPSYSCSRIYIINSFTEFRMQFVLHLKFILNQATGAAAKQFNAQQQMQMLFNSDLSCKCFYTKLQPSDLIQPISNAFAIGAAIHYQVLPAAANSFTSLLINSNLHYSAIRAADFSRSRIL